MKLIGALGFIVLSIIFYNREEKVNRWFSQHKYMHRLFPFVFCLFLSVVFALDLNLSPLNNSALGTDSSVFLYIGKSMYHGMIPYKELFDHKGIVLYFIEYIGFLIGFGNQIGVWIVEIVNIYVTLILFYFIARLLTESRIVCYLTVYIISVFCSLGFFEGGNLVEEYALPWVSLSLYIVVSFFVRKKYKQWHVVALGFSCFVVFFLRVNMVGPWCALFMITLLFLAKRKRYREIIRCLVLLIFGSLLVLIPVFLYLIISNSFSYMIDYYFIFNLTYTVNHSKASLITFVLDCISVSGLSFFFFVYTLCVYHKKKIVWLNAFTLLFAYLSAAISGRAYLHYGMILIPFFVIPAVLTILPFMEKTKAISNQIKNKAAIIIAIVVSLLCVILPSAVNFKSSLFTPKSNNQVHDYLISNTSKTDDVLLLGNNVFDYISSERYTKNKYFYQEPPIGVSDKLYKDFISELEIVQSDYIINSKTIDSIGSEHEKFDTKKNYQKVIAYLNKECEKGVYQLEMHDSFQVYVRKK